VKPADPGQSSQRRRTFRGALAEHGDTTAGPRVVSGLDQLHPDSLDSLDSLDGRATSLTTRSRPTTGSRPRTTHRAGPGPARRQELP
jgi:hypothetical protein